jgi:hypothetical protein
VFVDGQPAGTWYNAGVSRKGANGNSRCWRDDDFPLPKALTAGKRSIDIRIEHVPTTTPENTVWTSANYKLFSLTMTS